VVTGAVAKPGVLYLTGAATTVLEALARAGGPAEGAGDELLIVRGGSASSGDGAARTVSVDLVELLDRGDLAFNLEVAGGDVLTIPPRTPGYIFVLGYVQRPGVYELREGMRVDAMRAMALSGGLLSNARAQNAYLLRETSELRGGLLQDPTGAGEEGPGGGGARGAGRAVGTASPASTAPSTLCSRRSRPGPPSSAGDSAAPSRSSSARSPAGSTHSRIRNRPWHSDTRSRTSSPSTSRRSPSPSTASRRRWSAIADSSRSWCIACARWT